MPINAERALDVTLIYLGSQETYLEIGELFGLSQTAVHKCVQIVINILCDVGMQYVKWPSVQEAKHIELEFREMAGLSGVIGALDGTHISIKAPENMQADYRNRKLTHSVVLLATCDSRKKLTFIDAGFPGSAHDSRVFSSSELYTGITRNAQMYFPSPAYHIIGDSAFSLSQYVMVPYKDTGRLTRQHLNYNTKLSQTRVIIEHTFGLLKGRFRRLQHIDADMEKVPKIVTACCVLHNITVQFPLEEATLLTEGPAIDNGIINPMIDIELPHDTKASEKRDFIAVSL